MVRYVIRFGDGTKTYTRKDLYMMDGNGIESQSNGFRVNDEDMDTSEKDPDISENEDGYEDNDNDSCDSI